MTPQLHVLLAAYDEAEVLSDGAPHAEESSIREIRAMLDARPRQSPDVSALNALFAAADTRPDEPGLRAERPPVRPRRSWRVARRSLGILATFATLVWVGTSGWHASAPSAPQDRGTVESVVSAHTFFEEGVTAIESHLAPVQTVRAQIAPARLPQVDKVLAWEQESQREELAHARERARQIEVRLDSLLWGEPVRTLTLEATGASHHALVPTRSGTP
jgi:hypothetical protein